MAAPHPPTPYLKVWIRHYIYISKSVFGLDKWYAKFRTGKFRPGIAFTICANQLHLPKNDREGLILLPKMALKKWNTNFRLEYSVRKKKQDYLFRCSLTPGHFPLEWPKKSCFIYFSTGFSRNLFVNGKQPLILVTGRSRSLECLRRNSVASTNVVKILPTAKMAGELGIVVAFYYY